MTETKHPEAARFALLYTTNSPVDAEGIATLLASEGIEAFPIDKKDSAYIFGEIELYVNQNELQRAIELLESNHIR